MDRMEEIGVGEEIVGKCHIYYVVVSKTVSRVGSLITQRRKIDCDSRNSRFQIAHKAPFVLDLTKFYYRYI